MGANLSSTFVPDMSKVVLSPIDRHADILMAVVWLLSLHGCAVIFTTCALVDRWKGPADKTRVDAGSVVTALLLSTAWPVVLLYLFLAD
ncbi:hypothetical protein RJ55_07444 [Drechmeria coniospora]|nr:hypothetical protein RJ55_07444 [Drechmeria coniospora]